MSMNIIFRKNKPFFKLSEEERFFSMAVAMKERQQGGLSVFLTVVKRCLLC